MARDGEWQLILLNSAAVVGNSDKLLATFFNRDFDSSRARIHGILNQFFDHTGGSLNHFASGDFIDHTWGKSPDVGHDTKAP